RIRKPGLAKPGCNFYAGRRMYLSAPFSLRRKQIPIPNGSAFAVCIVQLQWRESAYAVSVRRDRNIFLPVSVGFDSGPAIFSDRNRSSRVAAHPAHLSSVALVWWPGSALRATASIDRRAADRRARLRAFRHTCCWWKLLEELFSGCDDSGIGNGDYRGPAYHGCNEFSWRGARWSSFRNQ